MKIISVNEIPETKDSRPNCPACDSKKVVKSGKRYNMRCESQRYRCTRCGISFAENGYFGYKAKYPLYLKTLAAQLYLSEMSLCDVAEEINKSYDITLSQVSIQKWLHHAGVERRDMQHKTKKKTVREVVTVSVSTLVRFSSSYIPEKMIMLSDKIHL